MLCIVSTFYFIIFYLVPAESAPLFLYEYANVSCNVYFAIQYKAGRRVISPRVCDLKKIESFVTDNGLNLN